LNLLIGTINTNVFLLHYDAKPIASLYAASAKSKAYTKFVTEDPYRWPRLNIVIGNGSIEEKDG